MCTINSRIKIKAIQDYLKNVNGGFVQYVGIAADEPARLTRLDGTNKISLLAEYGYTEQMAYDLCSKYDLLSPIYKYHKRGGCWFCPNATYGEFAYLKQYHPDLWNELEILSKDKTLQVKSSNMGIHFPKSIKRLMNLSQNKKFNFMEVF